MNNIIKEVEQNYDTVKLIKRTEKSSVHIVRNRETGERFIFRRFSGSSAVYKKLTEVKAPFLPVIYGVEECGGVTAVLEEYICGDTLFDILRCGVLSEKEAVKILSQICSALEVLHGIGAVHRDVKPENIILRGGEAVLIDFDASRFVDPDKSTDTRILGTTGYAAPEQYGLSQTDARADIYSAGVVLNVMLTGEHPSTKLAEGVLGEIIQKCTMINPDMRYQSAEELMNEINGIGSQKTGRSKILKYLIPAGILAVLAVVIGAFSGSSGGDDIIEKGFCGGEGDGTNLEWSVDSDYVLTISGEGRMADYNLIDENEEIIYPWAGYEEMLTGLVIEDGVGSIGNDAFRFMNIPGELVLPESVVHVGSLAFAENAFAGDLIIPEGAETIGNEAFHGAGEFETISIPSTATQIDETSFRFCNVSEIIVSSENPVYTGVDGALFTEDMTKIIRFPERTTGEYTLPESVDTIGSYAFESSSLEEISAEGDINYIGRVAFQFYSGKVTFNGKVGEIKPGAFHAEDGKAEIYFLGGAPEKVYNETENDIGTFRNNTEIYYLAGTSGWKFDENGLWNGYKVNSYSGESFAEYIEIEEIGKASGTSLVHPPDFYDYWSADEILTEGIRISAPGNLEKYINYRFEDDVLVLSVGSIPEAVWKNALSEVPDDDNIIYLSIVISAPDENVCKIATHNGNGPTYSNLKRQEQNGTEIEYDNFNARMDYDYTAVEIASVIREDGKISVAPISRQSVFYKVIYWETFDGEVIRNILPYEMKIGNDCYAVSFEDEKYQKSESKSEYDTTVLDVYWEPIDDPERVVFSTRRDRDSGTELSVFEENGLSVKAFEKPGLIEVLAEDTGKFNPELMANAEVLVLPPDARARKEGESLLEWMDSVYSETKYVGCKMNAGGLGRYENPKEGADFYSDMVNGGYFYDIQDRSVTRTNILQMNSAPAKNGTLWYVVDYGMASCLIIDWYLEDPRENSGAKPDKREYIYVKSDNFSMIKTDNRIDSDG